MVATCNNQSYFTLYWSDCSQAELCHERNETFLQLGQNWRSNPRDVTSVLGDRRLCVSVVWLLLWRQLLRVGWMESRRRKPLVSKVHQRCLKCTVYLDIYKVSHHRWRWLAAAQQASVIRQQTNSSRSQSEAAMLTDGWDFKRLCVVSFAFRLTVGDDEPQFLASSLTCCHKVRDRQ